VNRLVVSDADYARVRRVLARAAGLVFDDARRESMAFSLSERLQEVGLTVLGDYLDLVETDPRECQHLLDEVTIQETHFFRNPPQVRALRRHVLPELVRHAEAHGRRLRVWSAGCSTGEEAYTVAMLLRELLPRTRGWDVKVLATDVSERALDVARAARYGPRAVQLATADQRTRFFRTCQDAGSQDGTHEVRPEVRDLVEVRHHNLVTDPVPFGPDEPADLVLCRNVTIYFDRDTTRALMRRLHATVRDGGYLFLGHAETLWQVSEQFHLVTLGTGDAPAYVYRRLDGSSAGDGRRAVLPDRRTADEGPPPDAGERRVGPRRTAGMRLPRRSVPASADEAGSAPSLAQVNTALAAGRYAEAAQLAGEVAAGTPMLAEAHYLRGVALVNAGRESEALVDLRKVVYLEPARGFAHFLLAGALARLGDAAAAAREYRAAAGTLGAQPSDATAPELGGRGVRELVALCEQLGRVAGTEVPPVTRAGSRGARLVSAAGPTKEAR